MRIPFLNIYIDPSVIRFCIVGVANTTIDFVIFIALFYGLGWNVAIANILSFTASLINSFIFNSKWSFSALPQGRRTEHQFILFTAASLSTLTLSTSILVFGSPYVPVIILKISTIAMVPILNYLLYRFVVFR